MAKMTLDILKQKLALKKLAETGVGLVSETTYKQIAEILRPTQSGMPAPPRDMTMQGIRLIQNPFIPDGEIYPFEEWGFRRPKRYAHLSEIGNYTDNDLANLHAEAEVYLQTTPAWKDRLSELAEKYGCDKTPSIFHSYTPFYYELLRGRDVKRVLEIGIGSVPTMSHLTQYKPGASLRMWGEYFPKAEIWGLDVDLAVMVNDGNIHSLPCDQSSAVSLIDTVGWFYDADIRQFDLIIDDGSHQVRDQALTANTFIPKLLSQQGVYIIEDVMWRKELYALLPWPVEVKLFDLRRTPDDCVFWIEGSNIY